MSISKIIIVTVAMFPIASASFAGDLTTKVEPLVKVPTETSYTKRTKVMSTVKDSKGDTVKDGSDEANAFLHEAIGEVLTQQDGGAES